MAITNELVKFLYGATGTPSTVAGEISFHSGNQAIYVGDGEKANLVTSRVKDAKFESNKLTVEFIDGSKSIELDFSDVASTKGVMAIFESLDTRITENATAISNLSSSVDESIKNLEDAYKAADALLAEDIEKVAQDLADAIGEGGNVAEQIETAVSAEAALRELADSSIRTDFEAADKALGLRIDGVSAVAEAAQTAEEVQTAINNKVNALGGTATGADASGFVTVKVDTAAGQVSNVTVTGSDIASAATLADVKGRLDTFLKDASLESTVDTLKEIQDWINGDGVDATELTQAIAEEARLRGEADNALGLRIDGVKATADAAATKSEFDSYVSSNNTALAGVKATAEAAAVKTEVESALALKADKTQVATDISEAKSEAISAAAGDATQKANDALTAAKSYANAIKVNGQAQSNQEITLAGVNIIVGGTDTHSESTVAAAIEELYTKVDEAADAGVQSLAVNANSSNYAEVSGATGAVTLTIKKVALADASENNTGVADAWDVKESIRVAKEGAISTVQGAEGDASTAATVAGAKAYADAKIEANALRWNLLK